MPSSPRRAEQKVRPAASPSSLDCKYKYKDLVEEIYPDDPKTQQWLKLLLTLPAAAKPKIAAGVKSPSRKMASSPKRV